MADVGKAEANAAPASRESDLASLIGVFRRNFFLMMGVAAVVVGLVVVYVQITAPRYTAKTTIALAPQKAEVGREAQEQTVAPKDSDVDTQVEALKSRDLAETVVKQLHLDQDPEFNKTLKQSRSDKSLSAQSQSDTMDDVVDAVGKALKVRRVGQTFLTEISFTSKNPRTAANAANAMAEAYVAKELDTKNQATRSANDALNSKLDSLKSQVVNAQAAVERYRSEHGLLGHDNAPLSQEQLSLQSAQLAGARAEEALASARYNAAKAQVAKPGGSQDVSDAQGSQTMSVLMGQRSDAARRVGELQSRYGPLYPDLVTARRSLAEVDAQIKQEQERVLSSLQTAEQAARARTSAIAASNNELKSSLQSGAQASVGLAELQRDADSARLLYEAVLTRVKETSVQQAFAKPDVRVDTPAVPPTEPSSPNKPIDIFIGVALGLGLGAGVALLRDRMTRGLSTSEEVETILNVPFLASVPTVSSSIKKAKTSRPIDAVAAHPFSNFAESFRTLGTALRHGGGMSEVRTILITSALPNEGKTTTAICLARVLAMGGAKVLFMDCDLRRRSANEALNLEPQVGLIEVLGGKATLDQAIINLPDIGFDVLPLAKGAHLSQSPFESQELIDLLSEVKQRYDLIVLDTAPILPVVDTRVLAEHVDSVCVLARWRSTPAQATGTALRLLRNMGVEIQGVALTQVDLRQQARSGNSSDAAYYYKAYEGYYLD